jgi:8-oxo-dGTP pyrophosphatase MutT (NUDIX family)
LPRPFEVLASRPAGRVNDVVLRADEVEWPDAKRATYAVVEHHDAAIVVAVSERRSVYLVRQWRQSWSADAWELPAGTFSPGEEPLACAKRELAEETGLSAGRWRSLGTARASALLTVKFHLFLARDLTAGERAPEAYEADMIVREVPFERALEEARDGTIQHAASIAALFRAQAVLA